jgi:nucleoside-diphosphate-sugar epimerase
MNQQYQPPQLEYNGMMKKHHYSALHNHDYTNPQQQQQQSLLLQQQQQQGLNKNNYVHPQHYYSADTPYIRSLHAHAQMERKSRAVLESNEEEQIMSHQNVYHQKAIQRRDRTIPPPLLLSNNDIETTKILSPMEWKRPDTRYNTNGETIRPSLLKPSMVDEICGTHAQSVVADEDVRRPDETTSSSSSYTYRDALMMPKARITRVLITGILSQPAYLLALSLKEKCNVDVMIGLDAMYPNSIRNRLRIQEQMAMLTKMIPKLVRPIFISYIGIDPLRHAKSFHILNETGEIDVVTSLTPTHIVHFMTHEPHLFRYQSDPEWKNTYSPYIKERRNHPDPTTTGENYNTALYRIRTGLLSMEQILASIAVTPLNDRPHFLYASASTIGGWMTETTTATTLDHYENVVHTMGRQMDEVMADFYYQQHGVTSIGLRLPNGVYGPWSHPESDLYQLFDQAIRNVTTPSIMSDMDNVTTTTYSTPTTNTATAIQNEIVTAALARSDSEDMDMVHVHDIVDATIAAMQYRPIDGKSVMFDLQSGETLSLRQVQQTVYDILDPTTSSSSIHIETKTKRNSNQWNEHRQFIQKVLGWKPSIPLLEGLTQTMAWHMDRVYPYGPPLHPSFNITAIPNNIELGDSILQRHSIPTCNATDYVCHGSRPFLPCASECSTRHQCIPTIFDDLVTMIQDLTEECDIVLYTNNFDKDATDLTLQSEYVEGSKPQICNLAFVRGGTELVENVINKVPDSELSRLGVEMTPENTNQPEVLRAQKHDKLNGRLLYRGWILIWTQNAPDVLSTAERFLLKLSPGKLFHPDVKSAVFIHQSFGVSPRADDVLFLVHEMNRKPKKARVIKRKTRPKAKFLIPSEPQRKAIILMSELKKQDSATSERLAPEERITTYEATRFMRYSNGEEPLGKEPIEIKSQREFYDRVRATINPDNARGPSDPLHKFELSHWVRSKWVAHDMVHEESRQLRCDWYQEHVLWGSDLDQLSFAFVMQKLELDRKLEHNEPDETAQKQLKERTEMKKLLSDTFEWHALKLPQNKLYSKYELMQILPFDMDNTEERELLHKVDETKEDGPDMPLYVRIISDRIMAYARKWWSNQKKDTTDESEKGEL